MAIFAPPATKALIRNGHFRPTNHSGSEKMAIFGRQTTPAAKKRSFLADKPLWQRENGHFWPTNHFGNVKTIIFASTNYFGGMKTIIFAPPSRMPGTVKEIFHFVQHDRDLPISINN